MKIMQSILVFSGSFILNFYSSSTLSHNIFLSRHNANITLLLMVVPSHQKPSPFQVLLQVSSDPDLVRQLPESKRIKLNRGYHVFMAALFLCVAFWLCANILKKHSASIFSTEDGGTMITQNVGTHLKCCMLQFGRPPSIMWYILDSYGLDLVGCKSFTWQQHRNTVQDFT